MYSKKKESECFIYLVNNYKVGRQNSSRLRGTLLPSDSQLRISQRACIKKSAVIITMETYYILLTYINDVIASKQCNEPS